MSEEISKVEKTKGSEVDIKRSVISKRQLTGLLLGLFVVFIVLFIFNKSEDNSNDNSQPPANETTVEAINNITSEDEPIYADSESFASESGTIDLQEQRAVPFQIIAEIGVEITWATSLNLNCSLVLTTPDNEEINLGEVTQNQDVKYNLNSVGMYEYVCLNNNLEGQISVSEQIQD